jgi:hypothetical protein
MFDNPEVPEFVVGRFVAEHVENEPVRAGSGACKACDCRGFRPTGKHNDVCAYCGHMWDRHW